MIGRAPCEQLERVLKLETGLDAIAGSGFEIRSTCTERYSPTNREARLTDIFYAMGAGEAQINQSKSVLEIISSSGRILIAEKVGTTAAIMYGKNLRPNRLSPDAGGVLLLC